MKRFIIHPFLFINIFLLIFFSFNGQANADCGVLISNTCSSGAECDNPCFNYCIDQGNPPCDPVGSVPGPGDDFCCYNPGAGYCSGANSCSCDDGDSDPGNDPEVTLENTCSLGNMPPLVACSFGNQCCDSNAECLVSPLATPTPAPPEPIPAYEPCQGIASGECTGCVAGGGAWTALGCLPVDPSGFAVTIIKILFGLSGGVAFILIIYGTLICITSAGDPQKAQACRETITSAIVGLLMLIFALFTVQLIFGPAGIMPGLVNIFF